MGYIYDTPKGLPWEHNGWYNANWDDVDKHTERYSNATKNICWGKNCDGKEEDLLQLDMQTDEAEGHHKHHKHRFPYGEP